MSIKVDFLFQWAPGWSNFESVIAALNSDDDFLCRIIVLPFHNSGQIDHHNQEAKDFLTARGIDWIWHEDYDYLQYQPDMVFIQNPYDFTRPSRFSCLELAKNNIRFAYIPYGLDVGEGEQNLYFQYNMECHNLATWIFVRSHQHKQFYEKYCQSGNKHVYVTGHPKFDSMELWSNGAQNKRKVLLWTPHFVEGNNKGWSTFLHYCDAMIYVALTYPIDLIVRPHPLFIPRLKAFGGDAVAKFSRLIEYSNSLENIRLDFDSSYNYSFSVADALLTDAGSFLLEYLPTGKPILWLTHKNCLGLNESASFVRYTYPVAEQEKDIDDFVRMIIADEDKHRHKRLEAFRENFYIPKYSAGEEIRQVLIDFFSRQRGTRFYGIKNVKINQQEVLNFFEERAQDQGNHLTMTMYQQPELAMKRDVHEKKVILPKLMLYPGANVLDIGCGNGRWFESLKNEKLNYTGIDFSPSLIELAREKYGERENCSFHVMKANEISSELVSKSGGAFSHVIISGVLIYLNNDEVIRVFHLLSNILAPNAIIYLREPVANNKRLTLKNHWSSELESHYSAIYRTQDEVLQLVNPVENNAQYSLVFSDDLYPGSLNNRDETQQRYYIYKNG